MPRSGKTLPLSVVMSGLHCKAKSPRIAGREFVRLEPVSGSLLPAAGSRIDEEHKR
jgi:hypothetical protein